MKKPANKRVLFFLLITPVLLVIQLSIGLFIFSNFQSIERSEAEETKIDTYLRTNTKYISHAESAQRGYLLTGDPKYLETYKSDLEEREKNEEYLTTLPIAVQTSAAIKDLEHISKIKLNQMALSIKFYNSGKKDSAVELIKNNTAKLMMDSIRKSTTAMRDQITNTLNDKKSKERYLFMSFLCLIAALILFNLFLVWYTYKKLKSYTENLEHLINSLEDTNGRMRNYLFMSYHDLKTPLRGISGFAQLLKKKFDHHLDNEEKEYISYITDNVKLMDKTINQMREKYLIEPDSDKANIN